LPTTKLTTKHKKGALVTNPNPNLKSAKSFTHTKN